MKTIVVVAAVLDLIFNIALLGLMLACCWYGWHAVGYKDQVLWVSAMLGV